MMSLRERTTSTTSDSIISVKGLCKTYASGFQALKNVDLDIRRGEIFALLGPNGAGKTTLINIVCGIVNASQGTVLADGHDIVRDYRAARSKIGLVPQELSTDAFESVWATVRFSRGLFGKPPNPAHLEKVLRDLSLWDKRDSRIMTLSGGMKRRVLIAKALSHEPRILFLDEPTAGVDVELRRDMWQMVRELREQRRHHHPDHALHRGSRGDGRPHRRDQQGRADRWSRTRHVLMRKLGKKQLTLQLQTPLERIPDALAGEPLELVRRRPCAGLHLRCAGRADRHRRPAAAAGRARHRLQGPAFQRELARGHLRQPGARARDAP